MSAIATDRDVILRLMTDVAELKLRGRDMVAAIDSLRAAATDFNAVLDSVADGVNAIAQRIDGHDRRLEDIEHRLAALEER